MLQFTSKRLELPRYDEYSNKSKPSQLQSTFFRRFVQLYHELLYCRLSLHRSQPPATRAVPITPVSWAVRARKHSSVVFLSSSTSKLNIIKQANFCAYLSLSFHPRSFWSCSISWLGRILSISATILTHFIPLLYYTLKYVKTFVFLGYSIINNK